MYTEQLSQALAVVGRIPAAAVAVGNVLTGAIDLSKGRRWLFVVDAGTPGASGTIDFVVKAATTSGGSYTNISGTSIVQLTATGVGLVEVTAEAIQGLNLGYAFIKGSLTVGTATSPVSVVAYSVAPRNDPNSANNISGVAAPVVFS
jgi:hypothetical protein